MPKELLPIRHWGRLVVPSSHEHDPGFRDLVQDLSAKGMRAVGIMGIIGPSVYISSYVLAGRALSWSDYDAVGSVLLWDKVTIAAMGVACIALASSRWAARVGRPIVAIFVLTAGLVSYTDDIIRGSVEFSAAWWAFMFLIAVSTMPYQPWHTLVLGTMATLIFVVAPTGMSPVTGHTALTLDGQQIIFMVVLVFLCVGISALVYSNRYYQYLKRKRIGHLEELTRRRFSTYVPNEVVNEILQRPESVNLAGEKRRVTMLMSDLRGFSVVSETSPPERVVELLNIYLGQMADVIAAYGGTIDEFIGDAIFVLFGAPVSHQDDALRAIACAIDMQINMEKVNAELEERGMTRIEMGIGVHTGDVVVGSIGSATRAKYGVVGNHVNLTARIESYTVGGQILTTESTLQDAGDQVFIGRQMRLSTKGFAQPVSIYEVEGVGAPYDLSLPIWHEELHELRPPWRFDYTILDGKHLTGPEGVGSIDQLSTTGAIVHLSQRVESLSNLKMRLLGLADQDESVGDLYCKVVDEAEEGEVRVRFTAVPIDVADMVRRACGSDVSA